MLKVGLPIGDATKGCEPCFPFPVMDCNEDDVSTWTMDDALLCGLELFSLPGVRVPAPALAPTEGVVGGAAASFDARELRKLPIPDPHAPSVARAACAVSARLGGGGDCGCGGGGGCGSAGVFDVRRTKPTPRDNGLSPPPRG